MTQVGFLWDSLSDNTGDQAIGLTLLRLARRAGLERLVPVTIGEPLAERYAMLVIGGGELLHPSGHGFYDVFRVPGEHVLNTVGVVGEAEAAYLGDYRLLAVRSQADRAALRGLDRSVEVAPCLTVLFDEVVEAAPVPADASGRVLIHLHAGVFQPGSAVLLARSLRTLGADVGFLPFTPYNRDGELQSAFAAAAGLPAPPRLDGADQAFQLIRRSAAVVTASLHATIFAYVAGVPFLAVAATAKIGRFLAERGLGHRLLRSLDGLHEKRSLLDPASVDWQSSLAVDRQRARATADRILAHVDEALTAPPKPRRAYAWLRPTHPVHTHTLAIALHAAYGERIADLVTHEIEIDRARQARATLQSRLEQVEGERAQSRPSGR